MTRDVIIVAVVVVIVSVRCQPYYYMVKSLRKSDFIERCYAPAIRKLHIVVSSAATVTVRLLLPMSNDRSVGDA